MVIDHQVHKDNEWTIGGRRSACGASTTIFLQALDDQEEIQIQVCEERDAAFRLLP
jgi:hypothetical protein